MVMFPRSDFPIRLRYAVAISAAIAISLGAIPALVVAFCCINSDQQDEFGFLVFGGAFLLAAGSSFAIVIPSIVVGWLFLGLIDVSVFCRRWSERLDGSRPVSPSSHERGAMMPHHERLVP